MKFDRNAYQRELMRKRRAEKKAEAMILGPPPVKPGTRLKGRK